MISNCFGRGESSLFLSVNLHLKVKISSLLLKHPLWQWKLSSPNCNLTRMWQSPSVYAIMAAWEQMTRVLSQCCGTCILKDLSYWNLVGLCMCALYIASDNVLFWWCTNPILSIPFYLRYCCSIILLEVKRVIFLCHKTIYSSGNDFLLVHLLFRAQSS